MKLVETQAEFNRLKQEAGNKLIVVDFFATWCGPCRMIGPKIDKLSEKYKDVLFLKIDIDEAGVADLVEEEDVNVMPTFVLIKNGKKIDKMEGNVPDKLEKAVEKNK